MDKQTEMTNARREFLARCGKLAVVTPPAMAVLLSAANRNYATAASGQGGPQGNNGFGNGGNDGVPGRSGFQDVTR
jgi:hypothetical protein